MPAIAYWSAVWIASFSSMAAMRVCDSMLPELQTQLSSSALVASYTIASFGLAYGLMQLIYGPLADRVGKLRVMAWVCLGAALANLACAVSTRIDMLILFRALAGVFSAGIVPVALAYIGDSAASGQRQQTLGRFISATITGIIAGQVIGAIAADTIGWRWAFASITLLFTVSAWLLRSQLADQPERQKQIQPVSYLQAVSRRKVRLFLPLGLVQGAVSFAPLSLVPTLLVNRLQVSLTLASTVVIAFALGGLIYGRFVPMLLRRFSRADLALLGSSLMAAALICIGIGAALPALWVIGLIGGLGSTMLHNTLQTEATALLPGASGTGVSMFALMLFLGQAFTVPAIAAVLPDWGGTFTYIVIALVLLIHGQCVALFLRANLKS
jgi:MFS transporter, YNFM family, putative membrane transport protein